LFGDAKYLQKVALVVLKETMTTWYVVYRGKKPGVYDSWPLCCDAVAGYSHNCYKGFKCKEQVVSSFLEYTGFEDFSMEENVMSTSLEYTGFEDFSMEENVMSTPCITAGGNHTHPKNHPLFAISVFVAVVLISLGVFLTTRCCKCV